MALDRTGRLNLRLGLRRRLLLLRWRRGRRRLRLALRDRRAREREDGDYHPRNDLPHNHVALSARTPHPVRFVAGYAIALPP
jgi:hypothetical protein